MSSSRLTLAFVVLGLLLVACQSQTTYVYNFDTIRRFAPSYNLGYILSGTTIMLNLTTNANTVNFAATPFVLESDDWLSATSAPTTSIPPTTTTCAATPTACVVTFNVGTSGIYRLNITNYLNTPLGNQMQLFQMQVSSYLTTSGGPSNSTATISTLLKLSETFRDRVAKLIYLDSAQQATFTLYPVESADDSAGNDQLLLYNVSTISDGGALYTLVATPVTLAKTYATKTQTYSTTSSTPLSQGYYVLAVKYAPSNGLVQNFIRLTFPSNSYSCPFNNQFPDYYKNFQPCSGSSTDQTVQPGFPCISFNPTTKICTSCVGGYDLINGACIVNTTCPSGYYFHFGQCLPVSKTCKTFDSFTGACLTCQQADYVIVNGLCVPPEVTCTSRQYKIDNKCFNASDLCKTFDATGACTSCYDGYQVKGTTCALIVPVCTDKQYLKNNVCKNLPPNCPSFDTTTETCVSCDRGYHISNGRCVKTECPEGQVPSQYGVFCINVSPLCANYDKLTGECLSCKNKGEIVSNGACIQVISAIAGCQALQQLGYGECVKPEVNCDSFNLVTQECDKCLPNYFKDHTGRCLLTTVTCQSDEVSIQGYCYQVPNNCLKIDNNGYCTTCSTGDYHIVNGQCVYQKTCQANQYISAFGECVDVPSDCSAFNPSSGVCLTCSNGDAAVGGLCCDGGQVAYFGECINPSDYQGLLESAQSSDVPVCTKMHPSMGRCLECNKP